MNLASITDPSSQSSTNNRLYTSSTHQRIIEALSKRAMTSFELRERLGLSKSCISLGKCLSELMDSSRVVRRRLEGTHVYSYSLADSVPDPSSLLHAVDQVSEHPSMNQSAPQDAET